MKISVHTVPSPRPDSFRKADLYRLLFLFIYFFLFFFRYFLLRMKIFSAIQGMLVIILLQPIQGLYFENYSKWYSCHVDFCNWEKYCDPFAKRCEDCSEKFKDCFTPAQESNCTIYCVTCKFFFHLILAVLVKHAQFTSLLLVSCHSAHLG